MSISVEFLIEAILVLSLILGGSVVLLVRLLAKMQKIESRFNRFSDRLAESDEAIFDASEQMEKLEHLVLDVEKKEYSVFINEELKNVRFIQMPKTFRKESLEEAMALYKENGYKTFEIHEMP